jgi:polyhydroxyalkanoate synthase
LLVRDNALADGAVSLGGRPIALSAVRCPVLNVLAERDGHFPLSSTEPLTRLVGSDDVEELRVAVGHLALLAGRNATTVTLPGIASWIARHSDPRG